MKPELRIADSKAALMGQAADLLVDAAGQSIAERGRWLWALAGGSTPKGAYELLAQAPRRDQIDWSKVWVFWGDERCVPPSDPDSNYGMARAALLRHVPIPEAQVCRMRGELAPESAAHLYVRDLRAIFSLEERQWPVFDTMLLGLGADGHTASLFPGSDVLERRETIAAETWVAKLGAFRLTLTAETINRARQVVFLVAGEDKASVVRAIAAGKPGEAAAYPAARIKPAAPAVWLLDQAAASQLPGASS